MTNPEPRPEEVTLDSGPPCNGLEVLTPRDVPLGGPRAMTVRRTLPQRQRSLIGAWCFLDHYGPDDVRTTGGMQVPPHPHTGLATVSWLFSGLVEHRDSVGTHAVVRPGELNLMTAGRGISHSERSTPDTSWLHGVQLWMALPEQARFIEPGFDHYVPPALSGEGWRAQVFLGSLLGSTSTVRTHSPVLGAEIRLEPNSVLALDVDRRFEHGILVDSGAIFIDGKRLAPNHLGYLPTGASQITITTGDSSGRLVLIGGEPLKEQIVMWWNFVGRSHDDITTYRQRWQDEIAPHDDRNEAPKRVWYGLPGGDPEGPLSAPALPGVQLRPRPSTVSRR
ncbi:MAG: pirin family protein [Ornithinimicrobium sp.]